VVGIGNTGRQVRTGVDLDHAHPNLPSGFDGNLLPIMPRPAGTQPVGVRGLELHSKANGIAALRSNRIAGEQAGKVDHVEAVIEVSPICLDG